MRKDKPPMERTHLREMARAAAGGKHPDLRGLSPRDVETLIHEFGVYQIELETQNEELRETRLALEEARDRYRELYDFAPVGYFTLGRTGEILEANLTGCALLGEGRRGLLGRYLPEFLTREGADDLYRYLGEVLATGERRSVDVDLRDGDRQRYLRLESVAAKDAKGEAVCRTVATDITERKEAEKAQESAKKAAEEASLAKSEFLANMSHEIRTPMTVFMAAIEHLLQLDSSPERRPLLEMADRSAQRLHALIDDILDFSRIEARRVELEEEPFALRELVRNTVEMMSLKVGEKNLRLEIDLSSQIPPLVVGDPDRLAQILTNLIGNAIKFTHEGEVRVSVQLRDERLAFVVSDTGIGIPEEKREQIFESFSQADGSFTRRYGGTGLGLAISKGLVELMGGEIGVKDRDGQGSVFFFTLPLKLPEELSTPAEEQVVRAEVPAPGAHILLAEDDPMIRKMILMFLGKHGWQVETAETGREAVQKWKGGDFDLVLMDLQMPEMDGLEATVKIREAEAEAEAENGGGTCIVGLTAHARREIKEECLAVGMDSVLIKPVQMKELFSVVENCLSARHPK